MRITKKFAGSNGIGKQIFSPSIDVPNLLEVRRDLESELEGLGRRFFKRIDYALSFNQMTTISGDDREINGYRVVLYSDKSDPPLTYSELLVYINQKKVFAAQATDVQAITDKVSLMDVPILAPTALIIAKAVVAKVSASTKALSTSKVSSEKGYINDAYRIAGFEHLVQKVAIVTKSVLSQPKKDRYNIGSSGLLPKKQGLKKSSSFEANAGNKDKTNSIDPSIDLQASALLLDFFRAAQTKEISEEFIARSMDSEDLLATQLKLQNYLVDDDEGIDNVPELKKMRVV
jgi:hypothetical protein